MRVSDGQVRRKQGSGPGLWAGKLVWVLLVACGLVVGGSVSGVAADSEGVRVVSTDATGIVLEIALDPFAVAVVTAPDGQSYSHISLSGFESAAVPGHPMLPTRSLLLAVPPGAQPQITVAVLAEQESVLPAPIYPASAWISDEAAEGGVRQVFARDAAAYAGMALTPAEPVVLAEAGVMRGLRLARLTLQPVQYRAAAQTLRFVSHMRVEVRFTGATGASVASVPDSSGFSEILQQTVINPEYVALWRSAPAETVAAAAPAGLPLQSTRYRITVQETGIYQLTYADLVSAGAPVDTLDPRRLRLYQGDQELALEVEGEADGRFDPNDSVRFYAEAVRTLYTETNILWLAVGAGPGRRMATRAVGPTGSTITPAFADTEHFEVNRVYRSAMPMASDVDHWYWGQMFILGAARNLTMTVPFTLSNPSPTGSALLTAELWGASADARVAPDHLVRAYINGTAVGAVQWDGAVSASLQVAFDQALLRPGGNLLTLSTPAETGARDAFNRAWEVNWLNFFQVTYDRSFLLTDEQLAFSAAAGPARFAITGWTAPKSLAYDVTDPAAPVRLDGAVMIGAAGSYALHLSDVVATGGGRYFVLTPGKLRSPLGLAADAPSGLRTETAGADYLIIAHADFIAGVEPLAAHRRSQGLRVRVVDVQDIYDEFSGGLFDPHAIRAFIAHAYFHWPAPAPSYVVLVGDGTYDFMGREGYPAQTFVPPFLAAVDPIMGETAADNRYVAVDGDDILPDLHLGRFPVNNQEELAAMVTKIVAYEAAPLAGSWRTRSVLVADNPDSAGQFGVLSDAVAAYFPPEFELERIYLGSAEYPTSDAVRAQQATLNALNAGALLFNYVGHASVTNWAAELLFGVNQLSQVNNGSKLPIFLPMTCLEGTYHNARYTGLAESVVRLAGRGAVASWSATGQGVASGHDYMHRGFYEALFAWDVHVLGDAATAGLLNLYTNARFWDGTPRYRDLIDTYVLLGDPATRIGVAPANLSLTASGTAGPLRAGDPMTYTVHYSNTSSVQVKGVVIEADLPIGLTGIAWQATGPQLNLRAGTNLVWDLAELAAGAAGQIVITGVVADALPAERLALAAEMRIRSRWAEADLADNRAGPLVAELTPADLVLRLALLPTTSVQMGTQITFTLSYTNRGHAAATGVSLSLPLPVALDDLRVQQTGPAATPRAGAHYVWDLAAVQPSANGHLTVTGRIPHTLTWEQVFWKVTSRISATWPETDLSNNSVAMEINIEAGDFFEPDGTLTSATRFLPSPMPQPHVYDTVGDQDWIVFRAQAGTRYVIRTLNLGAEGDTVLFLWDAAERLLAKNDDAAPGVRASLISWQAPADQDYYVMVTSNNPFAGFSYQLQVLALPHVLALPMISKAGSGGE